MADSLEASDKTQQLQARLVKSDLELFETLTRESESFRQQRETASEFTLPSHGQHEAGLKPVIVSGYWVDSAHERASFSADCPKAEDCKKANSPTIQFLYVYKTGWKEQK